MQLPQNMRCLTSMSMSHVRVCSLFALLLLSLFCWIWLNKQRKWITSKCVFSDKISFCSLWLSFSGCQFVCCSPFSPHSSYFSFYLLNTSTPTLRIDRSVGWETFREPNETIISHLPTHTQTRKSAWATLKKRRNNTRIMDSITWVIR